MSELIEYFARHYTLVLDNDEGSYHECVRIAREAITEESPDLTLSAYKAMSSDERVQTFAYTIGAGILALVEESTDDTLDSAEHDSLGVLLIREVLITNGSDLAYALGEHYMPEDSDAADFLSDEPAEDDDDE